MNKNYVFVIGAPRSGTTWLQTIIGAHSDVATTVELTLYHRYIGPMVDAWNEEKQSIESEKWILGQPFIWSEEEFDTFLHSFLEDSYSKVLTKNPGATTILDKHPGYTFRVDLIKKLIPQAKFIHLIRDGRNVADSLVQINKKLGDNYGNREFDTAALSWKQYVNEARKAKKFGKDYFELRYEDLVSDTEQQLAEIFKFCELSADSNFITETAKEFSYEKMKSKRQSQDKSVKITAAHFNKESRKHSVYQDFLFQKVSGDLLIELGYEKSHKWWSKNTIDALRIPFLHKMKTLKRKLL